MKTLDEIYGGPTGYAMHWVMWIVILPLAITAGSLLLYLVWRTFRDAFRFGRTRLPLLPVLAAALLFSAVGLVLGGWWGLIPGPFFLAAYALGRWRAHSHAHQTP